MQNTIENKAKFFALYWSQEVHKVKMSHSFPLCKVGPHLHDNKIDSDYLQLTPLSQISDEDAIEVIRFFTPDINPDYVKQADKEEFEQFFLILSGDLLEECASNNYSPLVYQKTYDYLRLKGYSVPFMGLSVEKLIEYGWVKLKAE